MNMPNMHGRLKAIIDSRDAKDYMVKVQHHTREALHLLTRKRAFILVRGKLLIGDCTYKDGMGYWIEICPKIDDFNDDRTYLYIGNAIESRAESGKGGITIDSLFARLLKVKNLELTFPSFDELCELADESILKFRCKATSEKEANQIWQNEMLRLPDPLTDYMSDDFSSIDILIRQVSSNREKDGSDTDAIVKSSAEASSEPSIFESIDPSEFDTYIEIRNRLEKMATAKLNFSYSYGDDVFIEYALESKGLKARYCITEFYSNHNWNIDPVNLLTIRFCCTMLPDQCSLEQVRYSHPTKATKRKGYDELYLLDSLIMNNNIETKFTGGNSEEAKPSDNRTMDNLVDFYMWLEMHRKEIELL